LKNYRPLLFEDIDLRVGGLRVTCLRLNRHTPEARPEPHQHDHGQLLIYLSGSGLQVIDGETMAARSGTVIYVAPGQMHSFKGQRVRPPLCLVLDIELEGTRRVVTPRADLSATGLTQIRTRLSGLFSHQRGDTDAMVLRLGAVILDVLDPVMAAIGWLERPAFPARRRTVSRRVERALPTADRDGLSLKSLAQRVGFQQDYLNRLLKAECGLTLGQLRARERLGRAQKLLLDRELSISGVAERVGMLDNNYFARWFRQQTGVTPSAWRTG
jgi:AraC family transcriptional activator of pobA